MKTLAQRRAATALRWKDKSFGGKKEGNVVSGFPMLIRTDGFLPALAYAVEKKEDKQAKQLVPKNLGEFQIAAALVEHLSGEALEGAKRESLQVGDGERPLRPSGLGDQRREDLRQQPRFLVEITQDGIGRR